MVPACWVRSRVAEIPSRASGATSSAHGYRLQPEPLVDPPAWFFLLRFNLILYVIAALIVRKTARCSSLCDVGTGERRTRGTPRGVGLCSSWGFRRHRRMCRQCGRASRARGTRSDRFMSRFVVVPIIIVSGIVVPDDGLTSRSSRRSHSGSVWLKKVLTPASSPRCSAWDLVALVFGPPVKDELTPAWPPVRAWLADAVSRQPGVAARTSGRSPTVRDLRVAWPS